MNRHPVICVACLFIMILLGVAGFIIFKKFVLGSGSSEPDYDAEVDVSYVVNGSASTQSTLWDLHKDIKTTNTFKIHLFNVENPSEVLEGGKPILKEVGPYAYDLIKKRVTLGLYEDHDSVRYKDYTEYYFRPDLSNGTESDVVTIINMPWVGLAQEVSRLSAFSRFIVMAIVSRYQESVFMTRNVTDLLFGGFYHELIATFSGITGETYMPNNTFGLFYGRNHTFLDPREVNLGLKDPSKFGLVTKWKGLNEMEWWGEKDEWDDEPKEEKCNKIQGSDFNLFHPGVSKGEDLIVFADQMCRNIKFSFEKDVTVGGVSGYRFIIPHSEYEDPRTNAENVCYCTEKGEDLEDCPKDGAYQLNACSKGASVLLSHPHFYNGHEEYVNGASGLRPAQETHQTFIDIEPTTGLVLRYVKRVQVNLHLRPLKSVTEFNNVPNMIFPVMWTEETATMSEEGLVELKAKLRKKFIPPIQSVQLGSMSSWLGVAVFLPLMLVSLIIAVIHRNRKVSRISKQEDGVEFTLIATAPKCLEPECDIA